MAAIRDGKIAIGVYCAVMLSAAGTQAPVPDFTGSWAIRGGSFDFAPPPTGIGPGPLVNVSGNRLVPIANHNSPLLQPWAAAIVKRHGDLLAAGKIAPDAHTSCHPMGAPYILQVRGPVQFLQTRDFVQIIYADNNQRRLVHLNRPHSPSPEPSWFGESVGHYEGDTLVVDTIGIAVHEVSAIDRFGTPHTEAMHLIERYRLAPDRSSISVVFTVNDPGTFTSPWHASATYFVSPEAFEEDICAENIRNIGSNGVIVVPEDTKVNF